MSIEQVAGALILLILAVAVVWVTVDTMGWREACIGWAVSFGFTALVFLGLWLLLMP